jgi:hypothetical protein
MNVVTNSMLGPGGDSATTRLAGVILRAELVVVACTFFVFAFLHLGTNPAGIAEPRILPATIVEGICGLCLALAAVATFAGTARAWQLAVTAHIISISGVLLGLLAQASGHGATELNAVYHRTVLTVLIVSFVLLLTRSGRVALRKSLHKTEYAVKSNGSDEYD